MPIKKKQNVSKNLDFNLLTFLFHGATHNCPQDHGGFATIVQSTHVLHKFEFQNQPLFFFPLAIQKKIGKKLIEYFLNKKVNFFHVEQIMKYLKDSQNMV